MNDEQRRQLNSAIEAAIAQAAKDLAGTLHDLLIDAVQDAANHTEAGKA